MVAIMWLNPADTCDDASCTGPATAAIVMIIMGFVVYALGIVFALVGLQLARAKSRESLHDIDA